MPLLVNGPRPKFRLKRPGPDTGCSVGTAYQDSVNDVRPRPIPDYVTEETQSGRPSTRPRPTSNNVGYLSTSQHSRHISSHTHMPSSEMNRGNMNSRHISQEEEEGMKSTLSRKRSMVSMASTQEAPSQNYKRFCNEDMRNRPGSTPRFNDVRPKRDETLKETPPQTYSANKNVETSIGKTKGQDRLRAFQNQLKNAPQQGTARPSPVTPQQEDMRTSCGNVSVADRIKPSGMPSLTAGASRHSTGSMLAHDSPLPIADTGQPRKNSAQDRLNALRNSLQQEQSVAGPSTVTSNSAPRNAPMPNGPVSRQSVNEPPSLPRSRPNSRPYTRITAPRPVSINSGVSSKQQLDVHEGNIPKLETPDGEPKLLSSTIRRKSRITAPKPRPASSGYTNDAKASHEPQALQHQQLFSPQDNLRSDPRIHNGGPNWRVASERTENTIARQTVTPSNRDDSCPKETIDHRTSGSLKKTQRSEREQNGFFKNTIAQRKQTAIQPPPSDSNVHNNFWKAPSERPGNTIAQRIQTAISPPLSDSRAHNNFQQSPSERPGNTIAQRIQTAISPPSSDSRAHNNFQQSPSERLLNAITQRTSIPPPSSDSRAHNNFWQAPSERPGNTITQQTAISPEIPQISPHIDNNNQISGSHVHNTSNAAVGGEVFHYANVLTNQIDNGSESDMEWEPSHIEMKTVMNDAHQIRQQLNVEASIEESPAEKLKGDYHIVIDTNIFLGHLKFLEKLRDNHLTVLGVAKLIVSWVVLQELDGLKVNKFTRGQKVNLVTQTQAIRAIRWINNGFKSHPDQIQGDECFVENPVDNVVSSSSKLSNDDNIIVTCLNMKRAAKNVILLTNDVNLRNKACYLKLLARSNEELEDELKSKPTQKLPLFYKPKLGVPQRQGAVSTLMKASLMQALGKVFEVEMEKVYGDKWLSVVKNKSPWTTYEIVTNFLTHWEVVFAHVYDDDIKSHLKAIQGLLRQWKKETPTLEQLGIVMHLCVYMFSKMPLRESAATVACCISDFSKYQKMCSESSYSISRGSYLEGTATPSTRSPQSQAPQSAPVRVDAVHRTTPVAPWNPSVSPNLLENSLKAYSSQCQVPMFSSEMPKAPVWNPIPSEISNEIYRPQSSSALPGVETEQYIPLWNNVYPIPSENGNETSALPGVETDQYNPSWNTFSPTPSENSNESYRPQSQTPMSSSAVAGVKPTRLWNNVSPTPSENSNDTYPPQSQAPMSSSALPGAETIPLWSKPFSPIPSENTSNEPTEFASSVDEQEEYEDVILFLKKIEQELLGFCNHTRRMLIQDHPSYMEHEIFNVRTSKRDLLLNLNHNEDLNNILMEKIEKVLSVPVHALSAEHPITAELYTAIVAFALDQVEDYVSPNNVAALCHSEHGRQELSNSLQKYQEFQKRLEELRKELLS